MPMHQRADVLERAGRRESDLRHVLRLFEGERGAKLIRSWVHSSIARDEPDTVLSFQTFLRHAQRRADFDKSATLGKSARRLKAVAKLVEPNRLSHVAQHTYLPHIVDDLCARGLMSKGSLPVTYIRDTQWFIEALNNEYLTPEQYRQVACRKTVDVRQLMFQGVVHLTQTPFVCLPSIHVHTCYQ
ncbi:MAG: hypothetical protein EOO01_13870 [Chitinophagaceae bacterium]|nr:MAG: hypothetical protein EOO01_13870 [Chitinophagaceae bacterium]